MGPIGWPEMVVIFLVALLLFGPKKLPELGRNIGKAMTEFRRATNDLKATFDREMQQIDDENRSLRETARDFQNDLTSYTGYLDNSDPYGTGAASTPAAEVESSAPETITAPARPEGTVARTAPSLEPKNGIQPENSSAA
ncbi:MAG: Sec-independent protein translocase protein TatB [Bryobacteraceae bacterium]|nr:Sec-independent protein translocase protein TatB [Bryobacteraceae bacterium]